MTATKRDSTPVKRANETATKRDSTPVEKSSTTGTKRGVEEKLCWD